MTGEFKDDRECPDCIRVAELLPWFIQGNLPDEDRIYVARHLMTCPSCVAELKECLAISTAVRREVRKLDAQKIQKRRESAGTSEPGISSSSTFETVQDLSEDNLAKAAWTGARTGEAVVPRAPRYEAWSAAVQIIDAASNFVGILKPIVRLLRLPESFVDLRAMVERWERKSVRRLVRVLEGGLAAL